MLSWELCRSCIKTPPHKKNFSGQKSQKTLRYINEVFPFCKAVKNSHGALISFPTCREDMEDTVYVPVREYLLHGTEFSWKQPAMQHTVETTHPGALPSIYTETEVLSPYFKWAQPEQRRAKHLMVDSNGSYLWRAMGSEHPIHGSTPVNLLTTNEWRLQETRWVLTTIWITLLRKQHQRVWDCIRRAHVNGRSFLSFVCWDFLTPAPFTFISCFLQNEMVSLFGCDFFS